MLAQQFHVRLLNYRTEIVVDYVSPKFVVICYTNNKKKKPYTQAKQSNQKIN